MVEISFIQLVLGLLAEGSLIVAGIGWLAYKKVGFWGKMLYEPRKTYFPMTDKHKQVYDKISPAVMELSLIQQVQLIQQIYGRPIKIVLGVDRDGSNWLEGVVPYAPETDGDVNFYLEKLKEKDRHSPIG